MKTLIINGGTIEDAFALSYIETGKTGLYLSSRPWHGILLPQSDKTGCHIRRL